MKILLNFSICLLFYFSVNHQAKACTSFDLTDDFGMLCAGETVTLNWTSAGCAGGQMLSISVIDIAANAVVQFISGVSNTGSLSITLPGSLVVGQQYQFYIQTWPTWPPSAWDYGEIFTIKAPPAPVELISFEANQNRNKDVELTWTTAQELNNEGFEVQRSRQPSAQWETLGFVKGNGTTEIISDYKFTDKRAAAGLNYYRLKQVDYNGDFEFSPIVFAALEAQDFEIYPNPVVDVLNLNLQATNAAEILIYDLTGSLVRQFPYHDTIDLSALKSGIYSIIVLHDDQVSSLRFFKQ